LSAALDTTSFPCSLSFTPPRLDYGTVAVNTPKTLSVTVTDVGVSSCSLTNIALSATTDPDFTLTPPSSLTLAAGASGTINVIFDPPNTNPPNTRSGSLTFATSDPTQASVAVPLTAKTPS